MKRENAVVRDMCFLDIRCINPIIFILPKTTSLTRPHVSFLLLLSTTRIRNYFYAFVFCYRSFCYRSFSGCLHNSMP